MADRSQLKPPQHRVEFSAEVIIVDPPPLESGDRLTRFEFERRYQAMSNLKKAELIEGVVYMPSPVRHTHGQAHGQILGWMTNYCAATPGVSLADNTTVRLDVDNEVQPDALLRLDPTVGGRCLVAEDDYLEGSPELIAEVVGSSAAYDLHDKLNVYRRSGVQEYIVWQVYERRLDWFRLEQGQYVPLKADEREIIRSQIFPGLALSVKALLEGNLGEVLAVLQQELAMDEHVVFVKSLVKV